MTNYREILRLQSLGVNKPEIAASLHCARNTVTTTLQKAEAKGLKWPLLTTSLSCKTHIRRSCRSSALHYPPTW